MATSLCDLSNEITCRRSSVNRPFGLSISVTFIRLILWTFARIGRLFCDRVFLMFPKAIARLTPKLASSVTSRLDYLVMWFFLRLSLYPYLLVFNTPLSVEWNREIVSRHSISQRAIEQHQPGDGQSQTSTDKHIDRIMNAQVDSTECDQRSHTV